MSAFRSRSGEWKPGVKALNCLFSALLVFAFIPQAAFAQPSDAVPEAPEAAVEYVAPEAAPESAESVSAFTEAAEEYYREHYPQPRRDPRKHFFL